MQNEKRIGYTERIYACTHTLSGKCDYLDEMLVNALMQDEKTIFKTYNLKKVRNADRYEYYLQLNPNKAIDSNTMIKSFSDFNEIMTNQLDVIGARNFRVTRADMAINSNCETDYELFKKLNKLIISCIAETYGISNCYQSSDLFSHKSLSVAIKSSFLEAENYNKELENPNVETKNRLEFRSKKLKTNLKNEFLINWTDRLRKSIDNFDAVQEHYNNELIRIWNEDAEKPKKDKDFISLTHFLIDYRDSIFTRKQLVNLLKAINVPNAMKKADNFKYKHRIEFYSKTDLKFIIKAIENKMKIYFNN